jgi:hypothetical protein
MGKHPMMPVNTLPLDVEGCRLFGLYEASTAREAAATYKLLYPSHRLLHPEYMKLVGDLRATRTECNHQRLAVEAHRIKMRELDIALMTRLCK